MQIWACPNECGASAHGTYAVAPPEHLCGDEPAPFVLVGGELDEAPQDGVGEADG